MFGTLIRRKPARPFGQDEAAFDSTTFTLTTDVPRPIERRGEERLPVLLRVAKLVSEDGEQLIRVRNMSAGGLAAEHGQRLTVGEMVSVEIDSPSKMPDPGRIASMAEPVIKSTIMTRDDFLGRRQERRAPRLQPGRNRAHNRAPRRLRLRPVGQG